MPPGKRKVGETIKPRKNVYADISQNFCSFLSFYARVRTCVCVWAPLWDNMPNTSLSGCPPPPPPPSFARELEARPSVRAYDAAMSQWEVHDTAAKALRNEGALSEALAGPKIEGGTTGVEPRSNFYIGR